MKFSSIIRDIQKSQQEQDEELNPASIILDKNLSTALLKIKENQENDLFVVPPRNCKLTNL